MDPPLALPGGEKELGELSLVRPLEEVERPLEDQMEGPPQLNKMETHDQIVSTDGMNDYR
jgi:hypothetical protein